MIKNIILKILFSVIILIICFFLCVAVVGRVFHKKISLILIPASIPTGFIRDKNIQYGYQNGNQFFLLNYHSQNDQQFGYWLQFKKTDTIACQPSSKNKYISEFLPSKGSKGCIVDSTTKDGINERIYTWVGDNTLYAIFATNKSINDKQALDMANKLKLEMVIVDMTKKQIIE